MEKLHVGLGKNSYDIMIGENFFEEFPKYIGEVYSGKKLFVITDSNVHEIYEEKYKEIISLKLRELLQDFVKTKVEEGNRLRNFFKEQLNILKLKVEEVKKLKPQVVENYRERLLANVNSVKADIDFKEEDILKEILLFSDRVDITEEVSRLESHFKQLEYEFNVDKDSQGKKIEFIFQEIFREFNTMGVKSNMYEISKLVVEGKNELEKMREQIMNIE